MVSKGSRSHIRASNSYHEPISDEDLLRGFLLELGASGRVKRTQEIYGGAVRALSAFAREMEFPPLATMERDHVRHWLSSLHQRGNKPGGVHVRYRAVKRFFNWSVQEGEREDSPMTHISPPRIPDVIQPHYQAHDVEAVIKATRHGQGKSAVYNLRDEAIVRTLYDSGVRAAELCGMNVDDIDWRDLSIRVVGKAAKERMVSIGQKTATSIERYLRRRRIKNPYLWLASGGKPVTTNALRMMLERRFSEAGVRFRGAHGFRRAFAMEFLAAGGQEGDLRALAGWNSYQMVQRYAKATEGQRAVAAHKRLSPGDRLNA